MFDRHAITVAMANEALTDPDRLAFSPDWASKSGASDRTIGFSRTAGDVLDVITVEEDGVVYGVNGWKSNATSKAKYINGGEGE